MVDSSEDKLLIHTVPVSILGRYINQEKSVAEFSTEITSRARAYVHTYVKKVAFYEILIFNFISKVVIKNPKYVAYKPTFRQTQCFKAVIEKLSNCFVALEVATTMIHTY
jgi:hypothetical protein